MKLIDDLIDLLGDDNASLKSALINARPLIMGLLSVTTAA